MMRVGGPFSSKENWVYVVRCKDCKYWLEQGHGYPNVCIRDDMELALDESVPLEMDADDFCSRGKLK